MKANIYFKKDKKVKLITKSSTQDNYGNYISVYRYITDSSIWAYTNQLSQSQVFEAATHGDDEIRLFVLNYRNDLKVYDYIEYKNKYYTITRVDTKDDYNTELFVYVKDCARGDTPHDIQPASSQS